MIRKVTIVELRDHLVEIVEQVQSGDEVIVIHYGQPVMRCLAPSARPVPRPMPDLQSFRENLIAMGAVVTDGTVAKMRQEDR
jgi:antitoxin (DNA-binding transcriptional repressor) of toxin-antitoxin stability system